MVIACIRPKLQRLNLRTGVNYGSVQYVWQNEMFSFCFEKASKDAHWHGKHRLP